jgi:hypothetical protein
MLPVDCNEVARHYRLGMFSPNRQNAFTRERGGIGLSTQSRRGNQNWSETDSIDHLPVRPHLQETGSNGMHTQTTFGTTAPAWIVTAIHHAASDANMKGILLRITALLAIMSVAPFSGQTPQNEPTREEIEEAYKSKSGEGGIFIPNVRWERWRIKEIRGWSLHFRRVKEKRGVGILTRQYQVIAKSVRMCAEYRITDTMPMGPGNVQMRPILVVEPGGISACPWVVFIPHSCFAIIDRVQAQEDDQFFAGQPRRLAEALGLLATHRRLTAADAAGEHCHVGASDLMNRVVMDWLEDTLRPDQTSAHESMVRQLVHAWQVRSEIKKDWFDATGVVGVASISGRTLCSRG